MKECCRKYLDEQFGDDDVVKEIYDEYASSAHEKIAEAGAALAAGDWTTLDRVAHTLKGNALAALGNRNRLADILSKAQLHQTSLLLLGSFKGGRVLVHALDNTVNIQTKTACDHLNHAAFLLSCAEINPAQSQ